jgi:hypothetical protein
LKYFSLLIRVGNYARSGCGTAAYGFKGPSRSPEIAKFPVKFPVSREFARRQARSALRRQPASHSTQDSTVENAESARQLRLFVSLCSVSILQNSTICGAKSAKVSGEYLKYSRFAETRAGDGAISTAWCGKQSRLSGIHYEHDESMEIGGLQRLATNGLGNYQTCWD